MAGSAKEIASPFSRILVAVDSSEHALKAFDYAIRLSKIAGAKILVVHIIPPPVAGEEGIPAAQLVQALQKEGEQLLAQLKSRAETLFAVGADVIIGYTMKEGSPAKVILGSAKDNGADLIVMGSSGTSGVKELLLGSVSHAVSSHAFCPVLIVK
jgi:nucleotide-binding universal stress UspA family protein